MLKSNLYRVALISLAMVPGGLWADSFRCGAHLIREAMPIAEIQTKCGMPAAVDAVTEPIMAHRADGSPYQVGVTTTEYWLYDRGPNRLRARVTVKAGIAEKIDLLSRN